MRSERKLHVAAAFAKRRRVAARCLGIIGSGVAGWVRWLNTHYWMADDALHLRSGVFSPDTSTVPLARITAVDEVRGPVQRLFGVVALHVQTAGGGAKGEIVLSAVTRETAAGLRRLVGAEPTAETTEDSETWRLGFGALVVAAVTGPQLGVIAPLAAGAIAVLFQSVNAHEGRALLRRLPDGTAGRERLIALVLAAVLVLALAGAVVGFGGFLAERTAGRLRLHRGYVQRRLASLDVGRIHAVRIVEGALRRPLGLCSIRLEVAGYAKEPAVAQTLVPLCRRRDAAAIMGRLVPELPVPADAPHRPPPRALRRFLLLPALAGIAAGLAAAVASGAWPVPVAAAAVGVALGTIRYRASGWWIGETIVAARSQRVLARTTTIALSHRLQDAVLAESIGQRRADLATVRFAVASKHCAHIPHVDAADARRLVARLRSAAIATAR